MKVLLVLSFLLLLSACNVFSSNRLNFDIEAQEERRTGESVPLVGAKVGFNEVHIYGKGIHLIRNSNNSITDSEGRASLSFDDGFFFFAIRTFCVDIEVECGRKTGLV